MCAGIRKLTGLLANFCRAGLRTYRAGRSADELAAFDEAVIEQMQLPSRLLSQAKRERLLKGGLHIPNGRPFRDK